jgi:RNA polymerase sigma-70 factor (ECF subfamily)
MAQAIARQSAYSDLDEVAETISDFVTVDEFEAIFQQFQQKIISFIANRVESREVAYDLAQDTFFKAYRALNAGTTVKRAAFTAWLYSIAKNTTTDSLRRRRLISFIPLSKFNDDRSIGAGVPLDAGGNRFDGDENIPEAPSCSAFSYNGGMFESQVVDRLIVQRVLGQMDPKYSLCLWLYEHDGLACGEIADIMGVSTSSVKMRLMRGRERFADLYRRETVQE